MLRKSVLQNGLVALAFVYLVSDKVEQVFMSYRQPYVFNSSVAINSPVVRGGTLLVRQDFDHVRLCKTMLNLFVARLEDGQIVVRDQVIGGAAGLGNNKVVTVPVKLPETLGPGHYTFRSTTDTSGDGCEYQIETKDTPFDIVEK